MNTKKPAPLPVGNLPLGDYLRWLASTFGGEPSVRAELLQRAEDATRLLVACEAQNKLILFYGILLAQYRTHSRPTEKTLDEVNKAATVTDNARAAIAKAKGKA